MINTFRYTLKTTINPIPIIQTSCLKSFKQELVKTIISMVSQSNFMYMRPSPFVVVNIAFMQNDLVYAQDLHLDLWVFERLIINDKFGLIVNEEELTKHVKTYIAELHVDLIRGYLEKQDVVLQKRINELVDYNFTRKP